MSATRLGLLGLLAVVLIVGGPVAGHVLAAATGAPTWLGQLVGLAVGFGVSTVVLRRQFSRGGEPSRG